MKRRRRASRRRGINYNLVGLLVVGMVFAAVVSGWVLLPSGIVPIQIVRTWQIEQQEKAQRETPLPALTFPGSSDAEPEQESDRLYREIYEAVDQEQQSVRFSAEDEGQAREVLTRILRQPEFFWLDGYSLSCDGANYQVTFEWKYTSIPARRAQVRQMAVQAQAAVPEGAGEYDTALALHDWLCDHIVYEESADGSDQDLYGALVYGKCVCAGYSAAYEYLLRQAGIAAETVRGEANNGTGTEAHAWTKLVLEGETYYTDVTWDDQESHPNGHFYGWFALTSARMGETHFADPTQGAEMSPSSAVSCNYYQRNGWVLDLFRTERLVQILADQTGEVLSVYAADADTFSQLLAFVRDSGRMGELLKEAGHPARQYTCFTSNGAMCMDIILEAG